MDNKLIFMITTIIVILVAGISIFAIVNASTKQSIDLSGFSELSMNQEEEIVDPRFEELQRQNENLLDLLNEERKKLRDLVDDSSVPDESTVDEDTSGNENVPETGLEVLTVQSCPSVTEQLENDVDDAEREEAKEERDVDRVRSDINDVEIELDDAVRTNSTQSVIDAIGKEIEDLKDRLDEEENDEDIAEDTLADLKQQLDETRDTCVALKREKLLSDIQIANYNSFTCQIAIDDIQRLIEDAADAEDNAQEDVREEEEDVRTAEQELDAAKALVINLTQSHANQTLITQAEESRERAVKKLDRQEDDLSDVEKVLEEAEKNLRNLRDVQAEIRRKCQEFR